MCLLIRSRSKIRVNVSIFYMSVMRKNKDKEDAPQPSFEQLQQMLNGLKLNNPNRIEK